MSIDNDCAPPFAIAILSEPTLYIPVFKSASNVIDGWSAEPSLKKTCLASFAYKAYGTLKNGVVPKSINPLLPISSSTFK